MSEPKKEKVLADDIKETPITIDQDEVDATVAFDEEQCTKRKELGINTSIVMIAGQNICFMDKGGNVTHQGDGELIARVTWVDDERAFAAWRWGHTFAAFGSPVAARKIFKEDAFNAQAIAGPVLLIYTLLRRSAEEHKFDLTHDICLGRDDKERYYFGIRNLVACTTETSVLKNMPRDHLVQLAVGVDTKSEGIPGLLEMVKFE